MLLRQSLPLLLAAFISGGLAHAGDVSIAERPQLPHFATIQAGVDAALEGESLLVVPGTYASFTIDAKSVQVFVRGTGVATITGKVIVKNLGAAQYSVLSRLKVTGTLLSSGPQIALEILNSTGHVRVQDSSFQGARAGDPYSFTGEGARVQSSLNVVFSACTIEGGNALWQPGEPFVDGGPGLRSSSSSIATYDCTIRGGDGSVDGAPRGGNGGRGYDGLSYGILAAGCTFVGGNGGAGDYIGYNPGGVGGDALVIDAGQAHLLDNTYFGGAGGWPNFPPPGGTIVPLNGSVVDQLPGTKRRISLTSVNMDDDVVPITIAGQPGDTVYLMLGRRPSFVFKKLLNGTWMIPTPFLSSSQPVGTIGPGGTLVVNRTFDIPDSTVAARLCWLQAMCVDTSGQPTLTGPAHVLSLE
ncbi:MAG TPA: hypothetical protein VK843_23255 [Planctomycetota bacterium]|nr:hypothetical protein [Planctomycetota bacterium]